MVVVAKPPAPELPRAANETRPGVPESAAGFSA
jgi:hypothetical protein